MKYIHDDFMDDDIYGIHFKNRIDWHGRLLPLLKFEYQI